MNKKSDNLQTNQKAEPVDSNLYNQTSFSAIFDITKRKSITCRFPYITNEPNLLLFINDLTLPFFKNTQTNNQDSQQTVGPLKMSKQTHF